jgi:DNA mismatch endonuclease, patch repair protein
MVASTTRRPSAAPTAEQPLDHLQPPAKPDIVFGRLRKLIKLIFVHGCFWHAHSCLKTHQPKTNEAYWSPKLKRNQERDARHLEELKIAEWDVLTIWECELKNMDSVEQRLILFLNGQSEPKGCENPCAN